MTTTHRLFAFVSSALFLCFHHLFFSFISSSVNLCCLAWTTEKEESKIRIFIYDIAFIKSFFFMFSFVCCVSCAAHTESRIKWKWNVALERLCLVNFCIQMKEHSVHQFKVSRYKSVLANAMHWNLKVLFKRSFSNFRISFTFSQTEYHFVRDTFWNWIVLENERFESFLKIFNFYVVVIVLSWLSGKFRFNYFYSFVECFCVLLQNWGPFDDFSVKMC